jgi:hypothetical protein
LLPRDDIGSTLGVSLDRRFLDVVSPERTSTGVGAHYCVTGAIMSGGMACLTGRPGASQGYHGTEAPYAKASERNRCEKAVISSYDLTSALTNVSENHC